MTLMRSENTQRTILVHFSKGNQNLHNIHGTHHILIPLPPLLFPVIRIENLHVGDWICDCGPPTPPQNKSVTHWSKEGVALHCIYLFLCFISVSKCIDMLYCFKQTVLKGGLLICVLFGVGTKKRSSVKDFY